MPSPTAMKNALRSQAKKAVAKEIFPVSSSHTRTTKLTQLVLMHVIFYICSCWEAARQTL